MKKGDQLRPRLFEFLSRVDSVRLAEEKIPKNLNCGKNFRGFKLEDLRLSRSLKKF